MLSPLSVLLLLLGFSSSKSDIRDVQAFLLVLVLREDPVPAQGSTTLCLFSEYDSSKKECKMS